MLQNAAQVCVNLRLGVMVHMHSVHTENFFRHQQCRSAGTRSCGFKQTMAAVQGVCNSTDDASTM